MVPRSPPNSVDLKIAFQLLLRKCLFLLLFGTVFRHSKGTDFISRFLLSMSLVSRAGYLINRLVLLLLPGACNVLRPARQLTS
jgi:hypothetical protein